MKALFVCNQGKHRSRTAELIFKKQFDTCSKGLFSQDPLNKKDLNWADVVFVMEEFQRTEIGKRFPEEYMKKQILCLNIPDEFSFNQAELIHLLEKRMDEVMPAIH